MLDFEVSHHDGFGSTGKSVLVRKLLNVLDQNEYMFRAALHC